MADAASKPLMCKLGFHIWHYYAEEYPERICCRCFHEQVLTIEGMTWEWRQLCRAIVKKLKKP